ncbi:MAG: TolC family protein [Bacteroidetes bacterium]|nr:TolC family protein [Bacteroidota bacterium]MCB0844857.1 TolC family protein [Bacteroidota bacterium]
MVNNLRYISYLSFILVFFWGCRVPQIAMEEANKEVPETFSPDLVDTVNVANVDWREYFDDDQLIALIDTALQNNQELNIVLQEIEISKNEILERSGEYLPFVDIGLGSGLEKPGRFTPAGAVEHTLEVEPGREFPDPLGDFIVGATASWEVDIWRKLRNARDAAELRYLANTQGKNFLVTQLIAEIAESYYELMALDNLLQIINQNLVIQADALKKAELLKNNAKATQLAVNRFKAQLINTQNQQYAILQKRVETENRINFLIARYPQPIDRNSTSFINLKLDSIQAGIPAQLLQNRPDVRQAEYELRAFNLDILSARANFYPSLDLKAGVGFQAFNPAFLLNPESILFNLAGDLVAPLINRKAITARYNMASAAQVQSVYHYQQTLLNAYVDVQNQLMKLQNYSNSFDTKKREVELLNESVRVANNLFRFAKADYVEVLLTQEEALDAQMELVEAKLHQVHAKVQIYRALGGGWQ